MSRRRADDTNRFPKSRTSARDGYEHDDGFCFFLQASKTFTRPLGFMYCTLGLYFRLRGKCHLTLASERTTSRLRRFYRTFVFYRTDTEILRSFFGSSLTRIAHFFSPSLYHRTRGTPRPAQCVGHCRVRSHARAPTTTKVAVATDCTPDHWLHCGLYRHHKL